MLLRAILSWFYGKPGKNCLFLTPSIIQKKTQATVCQLKDNK